MLCVGYMLPSWLTLPPYNLKQNNGSYQGSVRRGSLSCFAFFPVFWMRWPPTLTSVPCKAGNEVSSTTTGQPATLCICCVWPVVGVGFPPRQHAAHTSGCWEIRPLTQASVPCQCPWWRLNPPSWLQPYGRYPANLAGVGPVIMSHFAAPKI